MSYNAFRQMEAGLAEKGISFVSEVGDNVEIFTGDSAFPNDWYSAIHGIGYAMRHKPNSAVVVNTDIPTDVITSDAPLAMREVIRLANASRHRQMGTVTDHTYDGYEPDTGIITYCGKADLGFSDTFRMMLGEELPPGEKNDTARGWTIVAREGEAIGIQKMRTGVPSFLSLVDLSVGGMRFKKGSYFAVELPDGLRDGEDDRVVYDVRDGARFNFGRWSAWAVPIQQRRAEFKKLFEKYDNPILRNWSLQRIHTLVQSQVAASVMV